MDKSHHECDVLVAGAGPAGLAAAFRSAQGGQRRVTVVDDNPAAGGQIWRGEQREPRSREAQVWFERVRSVEIELLAGARVFQQIEPGKLLAETSRGVVELVFESLVIATGARERFLPFPGWTLPNVMGAGGLQALAKNGLPVEGKKIVIAGTGPLLLAVAAYLREHGADVLLVAEQAPQRRLARFGLGLIGNAAKLSQALAFLKGGKYLTDCWVTAAYGDENLKSVLLRRGGKRWSVSCE
jgi:NADPH-dependent 2,4-dienoyl-CoA reductase/sulfur reductase-like enzyme